ncbi:hypothetical protein ACS2U0_18520 [Bacillus cereus group sp. BC251]|uniref:hypothetical protein n=1 Tax=Bacillus cereus group TaxID=86661 RepID=UPI0001DBF571|nr:MULTISPECIES: hypothetical protein [Bacillus cereus group]HDR4391437.1 hypothetical protein [Bacillus cereus]HDR4493260.1 hypothetical protein [Bacillus cereus biovar anthracis]ADK03784.1 lipoprotein, putative [Bacillus cereus biovar anthracis str. CI]AUD24634.1 hypothetical protein CU648_20245 [Bacillus sp. HBCD-sjtu]HDR4599462.1 hypothetical protein [Bacillus cereus]
MRKLLTVIGITFLMLAGCSNGDFEKEIDAGKTALTNKEYKNALSSFERALDEKKDDSGAIVLVEQTKIMMEAVKLKEEKKIEESIQSFEKVENMKDGNTTLIKQAKEERTALLAILEQKKKYSEQLTKSEELINKKNYAEAKETLNKLVLETKDNKNLEEYNKKAVGLVTKIGEEEKTAKSKATAKAQKTSAVTSQKVVTEKNQDAFTFEKAKEYIKNEYKENYDYTLENTQVENGKKYYQIRVRTTYKIEGAAGSGFTGVFKVFEDGTIVEVH